MNQESNEMRKERDQQRKGRWERDTHTEEKAHAGVSQGDEVGGHDMDKDQKPSTLRKPCGVCMCQSLRSQSKASKGRCLGARRPWETLLASLPPSLPLPELQVPCDRVTVIDFGRRPCEAVTVTQNHLVPAPLSGLHSLTTHFPPVISSPD